MGQNNEFGRLAVVVRMYVVVVVVIPYILQLSVTLIFDSYENRAYWPLIDDESGIFQFVITSLIIRHLGSQ